MSDDILSRLRCAYREHEPIGSCAQCTFCVAKAEIEQLRAEARQRGLDHITTLGELQEAIIEIRRLHDLITEWVEETDRYHAGETTNRSLDMIEADLRREAVRD